MKSAHENIFTLSEQMITNYRNINLLWPMFQNCYIIMVLFKILHNVTIIILLIIFYNLSTVFITCFILTILSV